MDNSIEHFDEKRNLARVAAGWKGSDRFTKPMKPPTRTFVNGIPPEVSAKIGATTFPQPTPAMPWNYRRSN